VNDVIEDEFCSLVTLIDDDGYLVSHSSP
jgi:hypothetical protein